MNMVRNLILPLTQEERLTLKEMGRHHRHGDFRFRARGLISLDAQIKPELIAQVLGVSEQTVYNWAKWWREDGLCGVLNGHKGGRPVMLTDELVRSAVEIATQEALSLQGIKHRVRERHPHAPDFSVDRLAVRLKQCGLSFKRCRLSLKKEAS